MECLNDVLIYSFVFFYENTITDLVSFMDYLPPKTNKTKTKDT